MPEIRQSGLQRTVASRLRLGDQVAAHHHDRPQLVYAAAGLLAVTTTAGTWMAPPTRAVWIPAGMEHRHRAWGDTSLRTLELLAGGRSRHRGWDEPVVVLVTPLLRELIVALTERHDQGAPARRRLEAAALDQLDAAPEQPLGLPQPVDERLVAATALLRSNPASKATLRQVGRQVGAGERTLSRLFQAEMGMGYRRWRTQLRLQHALALLAEGTPVTRTALACGWANPSSFIETFTRAVGQTPGHYLRAQRRSSASLPRGYQPARH